MHAARPSKRDHARIDIESALARGCQRRLEMSRRDQQIDVFRETVRAVDVGRQASAHGVLDTRVCESGQQGGHLCHEIRNISHVGIVRHLGP